MLKKRIKAFSLLEIALALMISGLAIACITPIWHIISSAKQHRINEEKFIYIRNAMQNYLLRYGYLPFASPDNSGHSQQNLYKGNLPYATLGLPKKYMQDSKGNPFSYIVNRNLTKLDGVVHIPPVFSLKLPIIESGEMKYVTFCRIYQYEGNKIAKYDKVCHSSENLVLLDAGISVIEENDHIFIMPELPKFDTHYNYVTWFKRYKCNIDQKNPVYKCCNTVAWVLIAHGKNQETMAAKINKSSDTIFHLTPAPTDKGKFNDTVFYQTRFDMAAQIECPCTCEPLYLPEK